MLLNLDENICRLCLQNVGCTNIFNEENIAINIMKCSRVKVENYDGLPQLICRECTEKLNVSIQFREQCEKSDRQIRQKLGKFYNSDVLFDIHDAFLNPVDSAIPEMKAMEYVDVINVPSNSDNTVSIDTENNDETKVSRIQIQIGGDKLNLEIYNLPQLSHVERRQIASIVKEYHCNMVNCACERQQQSPPVKKQLKDSTQTSKRYQCDACGRIFKKCSHLTVHSRIHTGEKPFKCLECDKTFIASHHLLAHQRVHKNERPYQCTHCGKCFSEVSSLSRHTKVHTGDKKYTCPRCPKRFITQCDARRHVFKHTGETPFQCQICFMSYAEPSSLSKHNKTHKKKSESPPSVIYIDLENT